MAKIIAVSNQKGGVGKTTSAVNLAAAFGMLGKRVLLIDVDPQGNATSGVGVDRRAARGSSYNIIVDGYTAQQCIVQTEFKNLSVIPSSLDLAAGSRSIIVSKSCFIPLNKFLTSASEYKIKKASSQKGRRCRGSTQIQQIKFAL